MHSGHCSRSFGIDRTNAAVRDRAAQNGGMQQAWKTQVVCVLAAPTKKAEVFDALDGGADERVFHAAIVSGCRRNVKRLP
jgi:hypothetical protein